MIMMRGKARYNIGEVAAITGMSIKTLRYYDKRKLLEPSDRDPATNYRYYSEEQILEALAIREMKIRGFTLEEIHIIMDSPSMDTVSKHYNEKIESIRADIKHLERKLRLAESSRDMLFMAMQDVKAVPAVKPAPQKKRTITVEELKETKCLYTRYRSRIFVQEVFWDRFAEIYRMLDEKNYIANGPIMAVFHEHYPPQFFFEEGDLEILQPVLHADPADPDVKSFGGITIASLTYVGFYDELLPEYVALIKWIDENGYDIDGDPLEVYLVEFTQGARREEYITRIGFPVRARGAAEDLCKSHSRKPSPCG